MGPLHAYEPAPWGRRLLIALGSLLALAVAGYIGSVVGPHFKATGATSPSTTVANSVSSSSTTSTVPRSAVHVVVANGTQEPYAAAHFSQQLAAKGWNVGPPRNTSIAATASTVYYAPSQAAAGAQVAGDLGLPASAARPISASASPVPDAGLFQVVVVIGPDLAGSGFPAPATTTTT